MDAPSGSGKVPKYSEFPDHHVWANYAIYWFENHAHRQNNILHLLAANAESSGRFAGWSWNVGNVYNVANQSICVVFTGVISCDIERDETVVHEIGHRFDLVAEVGDRFSYIDSYSFTQNHDASDYCIMSYENNWHNALSKFSYFAIILGSSDNSNDSLRDHNDN